MFIQELQFDLFIPQVKISTKVRKVIIASELLVLWFH